MKYLLTLSLFLVVACGDDDGAADGSAPDAPGADVVASDAPAADGAAPNDAASSDAASSDGNDPADAATGDAPIADSGNVDAAEADAGEADANDPCAAFPTLGMPCRAGATRCAPSYECAANGRCVPAERTRCPAPGPDSCTDSRTFTECLLSNSARTGSCYSVQERACLCAEAADAFQCR